MGANLSEEEAREDAFLEVCNPVRVRDEQIFDIILANQLVPGRGNSYLVADPNNFLYLSEKQVGQTRYFSCKNNDCHGRCKLENGTVLTVTAAHWAGCDPASTEISVLRFKKDLIERFKTDVVTPFDSIYTEVSQRYPDVRILLPLEECPKFMYAARRRVTTKRKPTTLTELGEWMEDIDYRFQYGFDLNTPKAQFFVGIFNTSDGHKFAAFRSETICGAATGNVITIEIDGTFAIVPLHLTSLKVKFHNCHQLLMVHYRCRKRNYPLGFFLVSHALTTEMTKQILQLVQSWL